MRHKKRLRRGVLAALAASVLSAPVIGSGCASAFSDPSQITSLRVLSVAIDKPYANPGDEVRFQMHYADRLFDSPRPVQILWLGGCFNPPGDAYYACYESLARSFESLTDTSVLLKCLARTCDEPTPPDCLIDSCDEFTLRLPDDLITSRPRPELPPYYGIGYVFFAVCAGTLGPISTETEARASAFPLGCFDSEGNQLGADSFVPGYTQIYAFEDMRSNNNPVVSGISLDKKPMDENPDPAALPVVKACPITEEERRVTGCNAPDIPATCTQYELDVLVDSAVAEPDGDAQTTDGKPLREIVWVNYFVDAGELSGPIKLISDAVKGYQADHKATWTPPETPGEATLWAVVRDSRGGSTILERHILVQ
jgi:hypothetical protein